MGDFVYFIPDASVLSPRLLDGCGLSGVLGASAAFRVLAGGGPEGRAGLLASRSTERPLAYLPDEQSWRTAPGGKFSLGWWTDARPEPAELARKEGGLRGHAVTLGDGAAWVVPVVRFADATIALDQTIGLAEDGTLTHDVVSGRQPFYRRVLNVWDNIRIAYAMLERGDIAELSEEDEWSTACEALAINYHVGPAEIAALGLITTRTLREILEAVVDVPSLMEVARSAAANAQKKTAAGVG